MNMMVKFILYFFSMTEMARYESNVPKQHLSVRISSALQIALEEENVSSDQKGQSAHLSLLLDASVTLPQILPRVVSILNFPFLKHMGMIPL